MFRHFSDIYKMLAKLAPEKDAVVWDIGAGTGSVRVECALAAYEGSVYAVEKDPRLCDFLRRDLRDEGLTLIEGDCLRTDLGFLPQPLRFLQVGV